MLTRATAMLLAVCLLLQVGQRAFTLGWFVLSNESFTEQYCQNWEAEAPMCFGSCKIGEVFAESATTPEQFSPTQPVSRDLSYCRLPLGARPQDAMSELKQGKDNQPEYTNPLYAHDYVGSVFWPPAV